MLVHGEAVSHLTDPDMLVRTTPQIVRDKALSPQEIQAIASFLSDSVAEFAGLASSDVALKVLPRCTHMALVLSHNICSVTMAPRPPSYALAHARPVLYVCRVQFAGPHQAFRGAGTGREHLQGGQWGAAARAVPLRVTGRGLSCFTTYICTNMEIALQLFCSATPTDPSSLD